MSVESLVRNRRPRSWDDQVDYDEVRKLIANRLEEVRARCRTEGVADDPWLPRKVGYLCCALIQLDSGLRAAESWDALTEWARTGAREHYVRIRKRRPRCAGCKHSKYKHLKGKNCEAKIQQGKAVCTCQLYTPDEADRPTNLAIIPSDVTAQDKEWVASVNGNKHFTLTGYKSYLMKKLKLNTHTLRYSFAAKEIRAGTPLVTVAQMLGHSNMNQLMRYAGTINAEDRKRSVVR